MSINTVPFVMSYRFHYSAKTRTFTAEISDFNDDFNGVPGYIDVGSARTGNVRRFTHTWTRRDAEREITSWEYQDRDRTMKILLFND